MPKCFKMRERRGPKGRVQVPRPPAGGLSALKCEKGGVPKGGQEASMLSALKCEKGGVPEAGFSMPGHRQEA